MGRFQHAAANLAPYPALLDQVLEASGEKTTEAVMTLAVCEFLERRAQSNLIDYFGQAE